jgi:hypothetical protein
MSNSSVFQIKMNFDKLSSELDKLSLLQIEENDLNDPETWLFTPSSTDNKEKAAKEEENLEKWLKGAVEKVDFRTRSALSRRLEKKSKLSLSLFFKLKSKSQRGKPTRRRSAPTWKVPYQWSIKFCKILI